MNKILIGLNIVLLAAVTFLFFKINSLNAPAVGQSDPKSRNDSGASSHTARPALSVSTTPTGKIAYINIDELNEKSLEITDLVNEAKRRKSNIEANLENLNMQYQKKMEDYQASAKAGLAPASELQMREKEILAIEKEAQNKQLQMENLTLDINEKNSSFQKNVKSFLVKWNQGRYDYVLTYSESVPSMLLGNASLEITKEVIENLNKEYKERLTRK